MSLRMGQTISHYKWGGAEVARFDAGGLDTDFSIADGDIINDKRPDLTANESAGGSDATTSATYVSATNVGTVTVTGTGRPILVSLQPNSTSLTSTFTTSVAAIMKVKLIRGASTDIAVWGIATGGAESVPASAQFIDPSPGTGSITYKLEFLTDAGTATIANSELVAVEI